MSTANLAPPPRTALLLARGLARALAERGSSALPEMPLANGRRADLLAVSRAGEVAIVEIKSSLADFRADQKWTEYRAFCDRLYFGVAADFPREVLPEDCGLFVADGFGAALLREAPCHPLAAARRKALTLRFALLAADRLHRLADPAMTRPAEAGDPGYLPP